MGKIITSEKTTMCAAYRVMTLKGDPSKINVEGITFRPGADLRESHDVWQLHSPEMKELLKNESIHDRVVSTNRGTFYSDGVVRVSGREYTSLEQSGCFQRGEMGCLSCHQLQCHDPQQYSTAHTHHLADSSGSNCYNCHLDKTLKWTADHLGEWYSIDEPELDTEQSEIAASILWLLKGDALGSDSERSNAIQSIIARWDQDSHAANPALLLGPENVVKTKRIDAIMKHRDDTPMQLAEYQCSWPSKRSRWSAGPRPDSV